MTFAKRRLYICDIDGTLLVEGSTLKSSFCDRINRLLNNNEMITFITGRDISDTDFILKGINLKLPYAVYNGNVIISPDRKEVINTRCFPHDTALKILKIIPNLICKVIYKDVDSVKSNGPTLDIFAYSHSIISFVCRIQHPDLDKAWIVITRLSNLEGIFIESFNDPERPNETVVLLTSATKEYAANWIGKYCHIPWNRMVVIGDGINDVSMMRLAAIRCVVGKSNDTIRHYGTHFLSEGGDAVLDFIERQSALENGEKYSDNFNE